MEGEEDPENPPEEEVEPKIILTDAHIKEGLSKLYRIPDGSSFAFGNLSVEEKDPPIQELEDVNKKSELFGKCAIEKFRFVRNLKLNQNEIRSIDHIVALDYLLELQAKTNKIESIEFMGEN